MFIQLLFILSFMPLFAFPTPIKTDYAIFLFDNGEKNHIAAMLEYAKQPEAMASIMKRL